MMTDLHRTTIDNQLLLFPTWEAHQRIADRAGFAFTHEAVFVSFSGGKDSVVCYLEAREVYSADKIHLLFADTGDEAPETYDYLRWFHSNIHPVVRIASKVTGRNGGGREMVTDVIDWSVTDIKAAGYITVHDEIRERYRSLVEQGRPDTIPYPGPGKRFCTKTLKVRAFERYIKGLYPDKDDRQKLCVVIGLRRQESDQRADTPAYAFDYDNLWPIWYPVFDYLTDEIIQRHHDAGIPLNPVYEYRDRSNCLGCPFASNAEVIATIKRHGAGVVQQWQALEDETGKTWRQDASIADLPASDEKETGLLSCSSGFCEM